MSQEDKKPQVTTPPYRVEGERTRSEARVWSDETGVHAATNNFVYRDASRTDYPENVHREIVVLGKHILVKTDNWKTGEVQTIEGDDAKLAERVAGVINGLVGKLDANAQQGLTQLIDQAKSGLVQDGYRLHSDIVLTPRG